MHICIHTIVLKERKYFVQSIATAICGIHICYEQFGKYNRTEF